MLRLLVLIVGFALSGSLAQPLQAAIYQVDQERSSVEFQVKHLKIHNVSGRFGQFAGSLEFEASAPAAASCRGQIQVNSLDTGIKARDKHLLSNEIFDALEYPTIAWRSTRVGEQERGRLYGIVGELTIKDQTKPVNIDVKFYPGSFTEDQLEPKVVHFQATTTLNRNDFGVAWSDFKNGWVGDDVQVILDIYAKRAD